MPKSARAGTDHGWEVDHPPADALPERHSPPGITASELELHDSMYSGGVKLRLASPTPPLVTEARAAKVRCPPAPLVAGGLLGYSLERVDVLDADEHAVPGGEPGAAGVVVDRPVPAVIGLPVGHVGRRVVDVEISYFPMEGAVARSSRRPHQVPVLDRSALGRQQHRNQGSRWWSQVSPRKAPVAGRLTMSKIVNM